MLRLEIGNQGPQVSVMALLTQKKQKVELVWGTDNKLSFGCTVWNYVLTLEVLNGNIL